MGDGGPPSHNSGGRPLWRHRLQVGGYGGRAESIRRSSTEQTMRLWNVEPVNDLGTVSVVHVNGIYDDIIDEVIKERMSEATSQTDGVPSRAEGDLLSAEANFQDLREADQRDRLLIDEDGNKQERLDEVRVKESKTHDEDDTPGVADVETEGDLEQDILSDIMEMSTKDDLPD